MSHGTNQVGVDLVFPAGDSQIKDRQLDEALRE